MKQAEKIFMISDAAKQVEVEAHVLRYWEDELKLPVKRNEMGHRYYSEEDIELFKQIKDWKEQGLQLKAIRNMLKGGGLPEAADLTRRHVIMVKKGEVVQSSIAPLPEETREQKSLRLQQLLSEMIARAVQSNNRELCEEIKESLLKELDYQFRLQEEKEDERELVRINRQEEYYRQIDELIRSHSTKEKAAFEKKEGRRRGGMEAVSRQKEKNENRKKLKEMKNLEKNVQLKKDKQSEDGAQPEQEACIKKEMQPEQETCLEKGTRLEKGKQFNDNSHAVDTKGCNVKRKRSIFIKRKRSIV